MVPRLTPALQWAPLGWVDWQVVVPMLLLVFLGRVYSVVRPLLFRSVQGRDGANPKGQRRLGRLGLRIFPGLRTLRGMTEAGLIHPVRRYFGSGFHFGWFACGRILRDQRADASFGLYSGLDTEDHS